MSTGIRTWREAAVASLLLLLAPGGARAQFSPGKLSRAHAAIAGPTECFKCHEPRQATTAGRCLACHRELGTRIAANQGFHGRMDAAERTQCGTCHAEHGGEDATLVSWPDGKRESFDHRRAGFVLTGKHAALRCDQCHRPELVQAEDVRAAKDLNLAKTHLGLSPRCAACHQDEHRGQFASQVVKGDCAACHSTEAWKKVAIDHATTRFPLWGRHSSVACSKCHYPQDASGSKVAAGTAGSWTRYRSLGVACVECHVDRHQNRFGQDCSRCHTNAGWKQLGLASFDHSRTRYPLTGKHLQLDCGRCHWSENAAGERVAAGTAGAALHYAPLRLASCTDCHGDPHRDRFGPDCAHCHTTAGWTSIAAGAFDHDRTRYPLRGRHASVACEKCHPGRDFKRQIPFQECASCHADAHGGQLARRTDGGACEACHTVDGFTPARYGPQEHATTRFPLQGAHLAVACVNCHRPVRAAKTGSAAPGAALAPAAQATTALAPAAQVTAALAPAAKATTALATAVANFGLRFESLTCAGCHQDPHAGQFAMANHAGRGAGAKAPPAGASTKGAADRDTSAGRTDTDCARCHGLDGWKITRFDHGKTRFPLEGAHVRTACASCHRPTVVAGRSVVRYRPLGTACRACHAEAVQPLGK